LTRRQREEADLALELREPLSGIRVLLDVLVREGKIAPEAQGDLTSIRSLLDRADTIVNRSISFPPAGFAPAGTEAVDLNTIAHETFAVFVASARSGNRLDLNLSTGALPVCGDAKHLSRVVYNLILNALEAVGKPGVWKFRLEKLRANRDSRALFFLKWLTDGPALQVNFSAGLETVAFQ